MSRSAWVKESIFQEQSEADFAYNQGFMRGHVVGCGNGAAGPWLPVNGKKMPRKDECVLVAYIVIPGVQSAWYYDERFWNRERRFNRERYGRLFMPDYWAPINPPRGQRSPFTPGDLVTVELGIGCYSDGFVTAIDDNGNPVVRYDAPEGEQHRAVPVNAVRLRGQR